MEDDDDFLLLLSSDSFLFLQDDQPSSFSGCALELNQPQTPPIVLTTTASRTIKPLHSKRSRRTEIRLMREEAAQLSALHESMLSRSHDGDASPPEDAELTSTAKNEISTWRLRADLELQLREQAMQENLRLRSQLTTIAELGGRLERQLKHQVDHLRTHNALQSPHYLQLHAVPQCVLRVDAYESYASVDLLERTQRLYGRTKVAVDERRLELWDPLSACVRDMRRSPSSDKLDVFDARIVPFELRATADSIWEWKTSGHDVFRAPCNQGAALGDTVQQSFLGEVRVEGRVLRCHGTLVFRRFEERDRIVFVSTARVYLGDPSTVLYHSQWIVVTRPLSLKTTSCSEIVCRDLSELLDLSSDASELPYMVSIGVEGNRERMNTYVDTKLLNTALPHDTRLK